MHSEDTHPDTPHLVQPLAFTEIDHQPETDARPAFPGLAHGAAQPANPLHGVRTQLTVQLGTVAISIGELITAREQQVLRMDQPIEEPVDVLLEGQLVARGVLVAVDDCFGVRITELPRPLAV
ncbi:flagellar motor switch protein [Xylophilus rhododendri]|uniref:Flagellar motor switch protein FliN n=1 Tax=Xylophilus rhododendri TaxID=2697032 RepID=A0A857J8R7_9BURK|nr:FliM/FliN family flagellar motor switch protein [Xylophilus rhododendri]QHI99158.1 flagellar motor switch protein [Xylophilus rhododendri]